MLKLIKENIPQELRSFNNWVGFIISSEGKKIPIDPKIEGDGRWASISNPDTWGSFEQAAKTVEVGMCVAIGFAMTPETGLIFVDLDCHEDKLETEEEKEKLRKQFKAMCSAVSPYRTYQEKSLSNTGIHLLAFGSLDEDLKTGESPLMPIEIYSSGSKRFVIMTGHKINDFEISEEEQVNRSLRKLHSNYFEKKSSTDLNLKDRPIIGVIDNEKYDDDTVLKIALQNEDFRLLWEGQWDKVVDKEGNQKYSQQHYADFALIRKLTFYTCNNPVQVERIFRQSPCYLSYGKNGKWSKYESDIRKDIQTASSTCTAVYSPKLPKPNESNILINEEDNLWTPDFVDIKTRIENGAIDNPALKGRLLSYIGKYRFSNIIYIDYLHTYDLNVNGNTQIVRRVLGDQLIFSNKMNSFFKWNGKKYEMVDENVLYHVITEVLAMVEHSVFMWIVNEVMEADGTTVVQKTGKTDVTQKDILELRALEYFNRCSSMVTIKNCADIFKKLKGMYLNMDLTDYQESPYVNLENGVLDLTTKELLPHSTEHRLHKIMGCSYDPAATCPTFDTMLETLFPDKEVRKEMLKAFGLCLAKEQVPAKKALMLLIGEKDTGKTTLINCINSVLGEYGTSIDNSVLMRSHNQKSNVGPELLELRDTLLISTSEVAQDARLDSAKIKAMTGNTTISTRNLYDKKMITFSIIGLIFIDSNYSPAIQNDEAMWSRLKIFKFTEKIINKDKNLQKKLSEEKAGIFNRLLEGLQLVLEEGEIIECQSMLEAKEQYKTEMTVTEQFIGDCLIISETDTDRVATTKVFETYQNWCKDNGFYPMIRNKFYSEMSSYVDRKKSGTEYFIRVRLSELGYLYSHMKEKTPQQFAKDKNKLLEGKDSQLGYDILKKTYYQRSMDWFLENVISTSHKDSLFTQYAVYTEWCIRQSLMPLIAKDFNTKVGYLYDNLTANRPTKELLEKAADIWS